ncbi:MAG: GDP-mannose 4,6-dehydratase [Flavobacteriales bacterium]|nr:GDP-mannose 4,6-dehydratase [Flavobacteriales bacterium]
MPAKLYNRTSANQNAVFLIIFSLLITACKEDPKQALKENSLKAVEVIDESPEITKSEEGVLDNGTDFLRDYKPQHEDGDINMIVEIPSGTLQKWEVEKKNGTLVWTFKNGKRRVVNYIGYPGNYGMVPQTVLPYEDGGDGDPLDVLLLGESIERGSVVKCKVIGVLNMLEAYRRSCPTAKFYQASSSEMFGLTVDEDKSQRETTVMNPVSPYGCSKVFGYNMIRNYRRAYKLHATNGILFNHESPRRGSNFVTNKVVKAAARIKLGLQDKLELGNMDSYRDWGHSWDYVRAMHLMMQHDEPGDWVVSTMETHSVREMCQLVFDYLHLDYKDYVTQNPKFLRPEELPYLKGDSTKIRTELGWEPKYTFERLMFEMVDYWLEYYSKNN